ncbi:hypothetical protein Pmani_035374 [Petrolisthes manimaculis]|uniref:Uncharacterized protein n=1 Tax=Petrolisthes manimaculis TaxID=1843537 RepID=A0AAE1NKM4_9EUCA|nr:hypothetical protein Pmani_035374 [Petrolisthes manimaculis]
MESRSPRDLQGRFTTDEKIHRLKELLVEIINDVCAEERVTNSNLTTIITNTLTHNNNNNNNNNNTDKTPLKESSTDDAMAVVYIVCVLLFFATSLLVLLVKYVRRERGSRRLAKFYEEYLAHPPSLVVHFDEHGRRIRPRDIEAGNPNLAKASSIPPSPTTTTTPSPTTCPTTPTCTPIPTPVAFPSSMPFLSLPTNTTREREKVQVTIETKEE